MKTKSVVAVAALAVALTGCSKVPAGQQAVEVDSYGSPKVSGCAKEESQVGTWTVDLVRYPARAISWDANNEPGAERGPYTALSKPASAPLAPGAAPDENYSTGQAEMAIPITITFDLTTDCNKLMEFHRQYGTKYPGGVDEKTGTSDNWKELVNFTVSQPAAQTVLNITQKYPYQKVWNDPAVRAEYRDALQAQLPKEVAAKTGGTEYFTGWLVNVGQPYPTDERLRASMSLEQSAQAEANAKRTQLTAEANAQRDAANAQKDAANAQKDAEIAKAGIKAAEIGAFPNPDVYLRELCMKTKDCSMYNPPTVIAAPGR